MEQIKSEAVPLPCANALYMSIMSRNDTQKRPRIRIKAKLIYTYRKSLDR